VPIKISNPTDTTTLEPARLSGGWDSQFWHIGQGQALRVSYFQTLPSPPLHRHARLQTLVNPLLGMGHPDPILWGLVEDSRGGDQSRHPDTDRRVMADRVSQHSQTLTYQAPHDVDCRRLTCGDMRW
jgi:hypothetical protein